MRSQHSTRGVQFPVMQEIANYLGLSISQHQSRIARAIDIVSTQPVVEVFPTERSWFVPSQYQPNTYYRVVSNSDGFKCDCPDKTPICKHVIAVWLSEPSVKEQVTQILSGGN